MNRHLAMLTFLTFKKSWNCFENYGFKIVKIGTFPGLHEVIKVNFIIIFTGSCLLLWNLLVAQIDKRWNTNQRSSLDECQNRGLNRYLSH